MAAVNDGLPKDYSSVFCDELRPPPQFLMSSITKSTSQQAQTGYKNLDGAIARPVHKELQDFFTNARHNRPQSQVKPQRRELVGFDILNRHFDTVFNARKPQQFFKVFIQYFRFDTSGNRWPSGETYVVRVEINTLANVKLKLPNKRPDFRYFFKDSHQNNYEEIEDDSIQVPYLEKDGTRNIYCQVIQQL